MKTFLALIGVLFICVAGLMLYNSINKIKTTSTSTQTQSENTGHVYHAAGAVNIQMQ